MIIALSADFIASEDVVLGGDDLRAGFLAGFVDAETVLEVARSCARHGVGDPLTVELSALAPGDSAGVRRLLDPGGAARAYASEHLWPPRTARLWLYLELLALWRRRETVDRPLEAVSEIYALFDYPEEIAGLVHCMPAPPGEAVGEEALLERWSDFLARDEVRHSWPSRRSRGGC